MLAENASLSLKKKKQGQAAQGLPNPKKRPLFTIHYSLFIIHYSLFIIHYSLFTIHYSFLKAVIRGEDNNLSMSNMLSI